MPTPAGQTGVRVVPEPAEPETVAWISAACAEALPLIQKTWGLPAPAECRIYVMTSWWRFVLRSAPGLWRLAVAAGWPLWAGRARQAWRISAAWTQRYGQHVAIGIKPPRLLEAADRNPSLRVFEAEPEARLKIQHLVCHELTHACAAHLSLPMWLNEGLAAVTVDRCLGKRTIRADSLALVKAFQPKAPPPTYRQLAGLTGEALAYHTVRGYWITHYLDAVRPGLVRQLLTAPRSASALVAEIAGALGLEGERFWTQIDGLVAAHCEPALARR